MKKWLLILGISMISNASIKIFAQTMWVRLIDTNNIKGTGNMYIYI
jgi:hypothetical protein